MLQLHLVSNKIIITEHVCHGHNTVQYMPYSIDAWAWTNSSFLLTFIKSLYIGNVEVLKILAQKHKRLLSYEAADGKLSHFKLSLYITRSTFGYSL